MKKIKVKRKPKIILFVIIFLLSIFIITYRKNYKVEYKIKNFNIVEEYYKPLNQYIFKIKDKERLYEFSIKDKYHIKKRLIKDILIKDSCIKPKGDLELYTMCYDNYYYIKGKKNTSTNKKYKKIKYTKLYGNIYVWNHKGYTLLNENKNINLFKKEIYDNNKSYSFKKYLITPNLEDNHTFDKFYVINMENGDLKTIDLSYKISYDFYYLGVNNNRLYIVDKKNKLEYFLDLKKYKFELVTTKDGYGKIWQNGWKDISMIKLSYQNYKFKDKNLYNYKILNKNLYLTYNFCKNDIFIDKGVSKILTINDDKVYYLKNNKIYLSSNKYSKSIVLEYDELLFNNKNQVFIY